MPRHPALRSTVYLGNQASSDDRSFDRRALKSINDNACGTISFTYFFCERHVVVLHHHPWQRSDASGHAGADGLRRDGRLGFCWSDLLQTVTPA